MRMHPSEFKAEARRRGWTSRLLAARWGVSETYVNRTGRDTQRPPKWDDALRSLPVLLSIDGRKVRVSPPAEAMTASEFKSHAIAKGWTPQMLAQRWEVTRPYVHRLANQQDRAAHWTDALRGLPHLVLVEKGVTSVRRSNDWL